MVRFSPTSKVLCAVLLALVCSGCFVLKQPLGDPTQSDHEMNLPGKYIGENDRGETSKVTISLSEKTPEDWNWLCITSVETDENGVEQATETYGYITTIGGKRFLCCTSLQPLQIDKESPEKALEQLTQKDWYIMHIEGSPMDLRFVNLANLKTVAESRGVKMDQEAYKSAKEVTGLIENHWDEVSKDKKVYFTLKPEK